MDSVVAGLPSTGVLATAALTFGIDSLNKIFAILPDNHVIHISISCFLSSSPRGMFICIKWLIIVLLLGSK